MSWTEERIERLKKMWHEGMTASQIADELGGVSRNAVIGKAHRLGLQARPSPVKPNEPEVAPKGKKQSASSADQPAAQRPSARKEEPNEEEEDTSAAAPAEAAPQPQVRSVGPGGFLRQGPGD